MSLPTCSNDAPVARSSGAECCQEPWSKAQHSLLDLSIVVMQACLQQLCSRRREQRRKEGVRRDGAMGPPTASAMLTQKAVV
eukprot:1143697-Pelagomonas_calceolata.AAC.1